jgi:hypothetical protein
VQDGNVYAGKPTNNVPIAVKLVLLREEKYIP